MSGREWQPGDVVLATVRGVPNVRVMCVEDNDPFAWVSASPVEWQGFHEAPEVTEARPLVVIDPEDREAVRRVLELFGQQFTAWTPELDSNVTRLQAALREFANPAPPRPEEPTGRYAVVVDIEGVEWLRRDPAGMWMSQGVSPSEGVQFVARRYADIAAVRVLSEGIQ